jgi:hypothetical protein
MTLYPISQPTMQKTGTMQLLYYDEVKYDPPTQPYFWLGGVCIDAADIPLVEDAVNDVSEYAFGSRLLGRETEFHGKEISGGRGNFKGREFADRLEVLSRLLKIIGHEKIKRVYIRIIPGNITHSNTPPEEIAFMYLIEQADSLFKSLNSVGMLFGDYDEPFVGPSVASLSQYRSGGTHWNRGRDIKNIIDTVHFARSHHSRMIQLADVFLFCMQFMQQDNTKGWRKGVADLISESGVQTCARVRVWPSEAQWYR